MGRLKQALVALGGVGLAAIGASRYLSYSRRRRQRSMYPLPASLVIELNETLTVVRLPDDRIAIHWRDVAESVKVFAGTAPDAIDRSMPVASARHADHLIVDDPYLGQRTYFELVCDDFPPRMVAERSVRLAGIANMRDIGGYQTHEGRTVRWGRVYRAGNVAPADGAALASLGQLGIRFVCDLRTPEEMAEDPDRLPQDPAPHYLHLPITAGDNNRQRLRTLLFYPQNLPQLMVEAYTVYMIDRSAAVFGDIVRSLADPANHPAIIHCTAGKDRTGVTIALLLAALGVPDETIIADYSLSNRYYDHFQAYMRSKVRQPHAFLLGVNIADFQPLLSADPEMMRTALAYLRERYGTVDAYLTEQAGLDAETLEALRTNLLGP